MLFPSRRRKLRDFDLLQTEFCKQPLRFLQSLQRDRIHGDSCLRIFHQCSFNDFTHISAASADKNTVRSGKICKHFGRMSLTICTLNPPSFCLFCAISSIASVLRSTAKTAPSIAFRASSNVTAPVPAPTSHTVSPAARRDARPTPIALPLWSSEPSRASAFRPEQAQTDLQNSD